MLEKSLLEVKRRPSRRKQLGLEVLTNKKKLLEVFLTLLSKRLQKRRTKMRLS
jgi:hypothetical protein